MKKFRKYLPSLDALVYFEAAARHGSFTKSAMELYVTQAAVSKRVRELESRLDVELFRRNGRTLELTKSGKRLQQRTAMALEYVEDACREVAANYEETIRIVTNSAISLFWLSPRLREFGLSENTPSINLVTSDRASEHTESHNHLAITYGFSKIPGWNCELLFMEKLVPVAAPEYFEKCGINTPERIEALNKDASQITLLEYERVAPDWVNWQTWAAANAIPLINYDLKQCWSYAHTIGEAIKGNGIALGSLGIIDAELKKGQLMMIGNEAIETGRGYYLIYSTSKKLSVGAHKLKNWLLASI